MIDEQLLIEYLLIDTHVTIRESAASCLRTLDSAVYLYIPTRGITRVLQAHRIGHIVEPRHYY